MKKLTFLFLCAATILAFSFIGTTAGFEGKVTYEISVDGGNMPPEAMAMFAGSELTIYVKGTKSRSDMTLGMQNTTTISEAKSGSSVTLMDVMGNKYKIKTEPGKDEKAPDVTVKETSDTKTIAGYLCKRAELTFKDETGNTQVTNIWYTEDITNHMGNNAMSPQFKAIKGMPLEYEMNAERGMRMKMTAKTVSKETVDDKKFDISADYKETTMEDMQRDMMKMMQGGGR